MFYITDEDSEDVFGTTDTLQDAIQIAYDVTKASRIGNLVLVEQDGKGIKQFSLTLNGNVIEFDC